jgi:hypothetical protein
MQSNIDIALFMQHKKYLHKKSFKNLISQVDMIFVSIEYPGAVEPPVMKSINT